MGVISAKCTNCGAALQLDDSREIAFCQYCGHKMIVSEIKRSEHTTIIRNEAEIMRAQTEAKQADREEKRKRRAERAKRVKLFSILTLILAFVILLVIAFVGSSKDPYGMVKSSAFTKKAFNITKEQVLDAFLEKDNKSVSDYGLLHTKWFSVDDAESYITNQFEKVYNGEKVYYCKFYAPDSENTVDNPSGTEYYEVMTITDNEEHVAYCRLAVAYGDGTVEKDKKLNNYFGITLPSELFSALTGRDANYINEEFQEVKSSLLFSLHYDNNIQYEISKNDEYEYYIMCNYVK